MVIENMCKVYARRLGPVAWTDATHTGGGGEGYERIKNGSIIGWDDRSPGLSVIRSTIHQPVTRAFPVRQGVATAESNRVRVTRNECQLLFTMQGKDAPICDDTVLPNYNLKGILILDKVTRVKVCKFLYIFFLLFSIAKYSK